MKSRLIDIVSELDDIIEVVDMQPEISGMSSGEVALTIGNIRAAHMLLNDAVTIIEEDE